MSVSTKPNVTRLDVGPLMDELNFLDMLPGIYFIFSRNGCDQAVDQCINAGLELTTSDEVRRIRRIVDEMVEGQLSQEDLKALHFSQFRFALEEGFAPHHAGMVAHYSVRSSNVCLKRGLVKMVFATETLALGHQYAGALRGGRKTREIRWHWTCWLDPWRVHPADRSRRTSRHRYHWTCRCCGSPWFCARYRGRVVQQARVSVAFKLQTDFQHGCEPA